MKKDPVTQSETNPKQVHTNTNISLELKKRTQAVNAYFNNRSKGAEVFDEYQQADLNNALVRAKHIFNLKDSDCNEYTPFVVLLPQAFVEAKNLKFKQLKKTDFMRFNQSLATTLLFGENALYYYQTNIDHTTGNFTNDHTLEIPYSIITTVEVKSHQELLEENLHQLVDLQLGILSHRTLPIRFLDLLLDKKTIQKGISIPIETLNNLKGIQSFLRSKRGL